MIWFATAVAFVPVALEVPVCSIIPVWSIIPWIIGAVIDLVKHLFKRG
jgi:amino acid transporter